MSDWHVHVYTSTYTADVSGVCSAMYELGGMTVLHDPSGCNSTYTTHDEPRWYDSDSLMFVSGLDELTAVYGDDNVLVDNVTRTAEALNPRFITLCGASIPHIIAFDFRGVARLIEEKTGLPVLPVPTDGLRLYTSGVGLAQRAFLRRFGVHSAEKRKGAVNLLGVTPIDFSRQEIVDAMKEALTARGYTVNACFSMGDSFEKLTKASEAEVNVVVSSAGFLPAKYLQAKYHMPYVVGTPIGKKMGDALSDAISKAMGTGENVSAVSPAEEDSADLLIIGEEVLSKSLARAIALETGERCRVLFPDPDEGIDEDRLLSMIGKARTVIADPLYRPAVENEDATLIPLPHEGYSGRIYRALIPVFCGDGFDISAFLLGGCS